MSAMGDAIEACRHQFRTQRLERIAPFMEIILVLLLPPYRHGQPFLESVFEYLLAEVFDVAHHDDQQTSRLQDSVAVYKQFPSSLARQMLEEVHHLDALSMTVMERYVIYLEVAEEINSCPSSRFDVGVIQGKALSAFLKGAPS